MFSFDSSSIHVLNVDKGLTPSKHRPRFHLNRLNNIVPLLRRPRFEASVFRCGFDRLWDALPIKESLARKICHLFWINFPWETMQKEMGEIFMLSGSKYFFKL